MSIIDELVTLLGLDIAPDAEAKATAFERMLGRVQKTAAVLGGALVAAAGAVEAYTMKQAAAIESEGRFADSIDMSYQRLQELDYATTVLGGTTQELHADLAHLYKTMSSPIPGEYNQTLYMLGISARDSSGHVRKMDEFLLAVGDKLATLSKQRQLQFAERLGISAGTMTMLRAGRAEIERLAKEAELLNIVLSDDAKRSATVFERSYRRMTAIVQGLGRSITVGLLPGLTTAANAVSDWVVANNKWISAGIQQTVEGVGLGFRMVGNGIEWAYNKLTEFLGPMMGARDDLDATRAIALATAAGIVALGVAFLAATWPVLAVTAALAALVLIGEDLYVFFTGGKSVIGDWVKEFEDAFPHLANLLGVLGRLAKLLAGGMWDAFKLGAHAAFEILKALNTFIGRMVEGVASLVDGFLKLVGVVGLSDANTTQAGRAPTISGLTTTANDVPVPSAWLANAARSGKAGNTVNIEVNGAGDPAAVGAEVASRAGLSTQMVTPGMLGPMGAH